MNTNPGIIGIKLGMTQLFLEDGTLLPCTVVQAGCVVVGKRTQEKDGYDALILGLGEKKDKRTSKALKVSYEKREQKVPKVAREIRLSAETVAGYELGQTVKVEEIFEDGQFVDVQATSKGAGFQGVMKRHNFAGAKSSHGAHEWTRHGGSIGMATTPGRVWPGKKMAGQHGNARTTTQNLEIIRVDSERNILLVKGAIPGHKNGLVKIRTAIKRGDQGLGTPPGSAASTDAEEAPAEEAAE